MNYKFLLSILLFFSVFCSTNLFAQETDKLTNEQLARYKNLTNELRCLVCQNEDLTDSTAPLAQDLRTQVADMILQNKNDDQIKDYLTQRYGEFILFKPSFSSKNYLLWLAPFAMLIFGLIYLARRIIRHRHHNAKLSDDEQKKLHELLK